MKIQILKMQYRVKMDFLGDSNFGTKIEILHHCAAAVLRVVRDAKARKSALTSETEIVKPR